MVAGLVVVLEHGGAGYVVPVRQEGQQEEQPAGAASRSSRSSSRSRRKRGIGAGQRDGVATLPRLC